MLAQWHSFGFSIELYSEDWLKNSTKEHPLKRFVLKSISSLSDGIIADAVKHFPQLRILDLAVSKVDLTHFITDALEKKPDLLIVVNKKIYVHSSLKAVSWAQLTAEFDLQWLYEKLVVVSFHAPGVPMLKTMSLYY